MILPWPATPRFLKQPILFSGKAFDGIIAALTRECSGNVHTKGLVVIKASSVQQGSVECLVDYKWEGSWYTANIENSWVSFEFCTGRAKISSYSIKSFPGHSWPNTWVIEVSNDEISWERIDHREGTTVLCGNLITHHFECQSPRQDFYQYVRMQNTGLTHANNHHLCLCNIEFFGEFVRIPSH
jgi:hypothetical protein